MLLSSPVVLVLIFVLIIICLTTILNGKETPTGFPPGPRGLPFLGSLLQLDMKKPHKSLIELSKIYGSVFSIQMGGRKAVVLCGYEAVKDALINHADVFAERPVVPIFRDTSYGFGVIFSHGENWKVMRRFTLTTLRDFGMGKRTIEDRIIEECHSLVADFKSYNGAPFENTMIMNAAVANIIVSVLLGNRFDYNDATFLRLLGLISQNIKLLGSAMVMLYNTFPALGYLPGTIRTIKKNLDEFNDFIKESFIERLKNLDANDQRSLIDAFFVRQQQEQSNPKSLFHDQNLLHLVGNLFAAGTETTSTTLRWALLHMAVYPDIQRKVQEEIERVVGSAQPQIEHRKQMPYTDAVVHEVQRFCNILPVGLPHETTADITFRNYYIPKGTYIIPLLQSVLFDKTQFERPDEFYPHHFLDSDGKFVKKDAFMPFSAGRRICAGENLAKMELFLFFSSLLQKFTFRLPTGTSPVDLEPAVGFSAGPKKHMICAVARY